jgi:hypothetical protein
LGDLVGREAKASLLEMVGERGGRGQDRERGGEIGEDSLEWYESVRWVVCQPCQKHEKSGPTFIVWTPTLSY